MVDQTVLFQESLASIVTLVTRPISLCKVVVMFSLETMFAVIHTWLGLVKTIIIFHLRIFRTAMIWLIALVLLPVRILTALLRERELEEYLHEMRIELEALMWDRKELEGQLHRAVKERKILKSMLAEVEVENDTAIARIELLEGELQDLKLENLQLKETLRKRQWSSWGDHKTDNGHDIGIPDEYPISYGIQSRKSNYKKSGIVVQELVMQKTVCGGEGDNKAELINFLETGSAASEPIEQFTQDVLQRNLDTNEVLDRRRDVALSQSLFSAVLSLLVGVIVWEAEDPCIPLVVALFIVVGMSLQSVVQFFSTIKNRPASDAVALLSFNWFILGTLTYPTLPRVTCILAPLALKLF